nr:hypothetical protein Iba_chr12bCG23000 [Ipomoea batatas]GMD71202.1 hypothetical protein Iba_chr12eCG13680 [Ipomoea batatas]GMD73201.1 hypothetical protein Iba_chr12fCG16060 [Ipomoea batatas]
MMILWTDNNMKLWEEQGHSRCLIPQQGISFQKAKENQKTINCRKDWMPLHLPLIILVTPLAMLLRRAVQLWRIVLQIYFKLESYK